jgi:hypothetical protein
LIPESSPAKREETLKNLRVWLDSTHFDHLRREKQWHEGTCEWIMRKEIFSGWLEDGTGAFWIFGIPGNYPISEISDVYSFSANIATKFRLWKDSYVHIS